MPRIQFHSFKSLSTILPLIKLIESLPEICESITQFLGVYFGLPVPIFLHILKEFIHLLQVGRRIFHLLLRLANVIHQHFILLLLLQESPFYMLPLTVKIV